MAYLNIFDIIKLIKLRFKKISILFIKLSFNIYIKKNIKGFIESL